MTLKMVSILLLTIACSNEKKVVAPSPSPSPSPSAASGVRRIELSVTENGFEPTPVKVKQGEAIELVVTRKTDNTCATSIVIPSMNVKKALPKNEPVVVALTPDKTGELKYGCAMDQMIAGVILVE